jgi:hypothetical protein
MRLILIPECLRPRRSCRSDLSSYPCNVGPVFLVFRALTATFHPVHNQVLGFPMRAFMLRHACPVTFRQDAQLIQGHFQAGQQDMDPFIGAGLAHVKQLTLHHLQRIGLGVHQNEQQFVCRRQQAGLTACPWGALALLGGWFTRTARSMSCPRATRPYRVGHCPDAATSRVSLFLE